MGVNAKRKNQKDCNVASSGKGEGTAIWYNEPRRTIGFFKLLVCATLVLKETSHKYET